MSDENFDKIIYNLTSRVNNLSISDNSSLFEITNKKNLYYIISNILLTIILIIKPTFIIYYDKYNVKKYRTFVILFLYIILNIVLYYINNKFMFV